MKKNATRKIYLIILTAFWMFLVSLVLKQYYFSQKGKMVYLSLATGLEQLPDEMEWMNIMLNGKKVGYSYSAISENDNQGYSISNFLEFNTVLVGEQVKITTSSQAQVDSNFHYRSFNWQLRSGIYNTHVLGEINSGTAIIKMVESSDTNRFEIEIPIEIYPSQAVKYLLARQGFKKGDQFVLPVFEPLAREVTDIIITHEGRGDITIDSTVHNLNKIKITYGDLPTFMWMDDNGISFREEGLLGLVLERTTVEEATTSEFDINDFDLADFYAVPVDRLISDPRSASRLLIEIHGLPPQFFNADELDPVTGDQPDKMILELSSDPQPRTEENISPFLENNALIQCTHPLINNQARELTDNIAGPLEKAGILVGWVYRELEKVPVANLASATEILKHKIGDCSEHTTLFTSLSRSLGIPTKINMGLVYIDGKFLYHAWPSVLVDDQWIAVDPTFGQVPADATHLPILEGDFTNMSELLPILGQISIIVKDNQ